jgi:hypothetical protein
LVSSKVLRPAGARIAIVFSAVLLVACGDGGGIGAEDSPPATGVQQPPPPPSQVAKGFYAGSAGSLGIGQAVLLPQGEVWLLLRGGDGTLTAARGDVSVGAQGNTLSAAGAAFNLSTLASESFALDVSNQAAAAPLAGTLRIGTASAAVEWSYNNRYETVRPVADFAGLWKTTVSQGSVAVTWNVSATGVIDGTNSTECTYAGSAAAQSQPSAVLALAVTETCPGSAPLALSGIATLNDARDRASVMLAGDGKVTALDLRK